MRSVLALVFGLPPNTTRRSTTVTLRDGVRDRVDVVERDTAVRDVVGLLHDRRRRSRRGRGSSTSTRGRASRSAAREERGLQLLDDLLAALLSARALGVVVRDGGSCRRRGSVRDAACGGQRRATRTGTSSQLAPSTPRRATSRARMQAGGPCSGAAPMPKSAPCSRPARFARSVRLAALALPSIGAAAAVRLRRRQRQPPAAPAAPAGPRDGRGRDRDHDRARRRRPPRRSRRRRRSRSRRRGEPRSRGAAPDRRRSPRPRRIRSSRTTRPATSP